MRYFVGFLISVGLIVLIIVLLFHHGGGNTPVPQKPAELQTYASTEAVAQLTIDTAVSAPQTHRQVRITVGRDSSDISVMRGYDGDVIRSKTYANTQASYEAFLNSLRLAGFTKGNTTDSTLKSEQGYCPLGDRYIFEFFSDQGTPLERFWSTSCGGKASYRGNTPLTLKLFQRQVPDYDSLTSDINF